MTIKRGHNKQSLRHRLRMWKRLWRFWFVRPVDTLVIVTGADSSHFKSLVQLLISVLEHESQCIVVVYDLGLSADQRGTLYERFPGVVHRTFDYTQYPAYFNIQIRAGEYAWKPIIIHEVMMEFACSVCWMDAGNILTERLYWIRKIINAIGIYSPRSAGTLRDWTHPSTLRFLKVSEALLDKPNLSGNCIALNPRFSPIQNLVNRWKECALQKECIAPEGADRTNHRQDQAVLSVLMHQLGLAASVPKYPLGFKGHQDID